MKIKKYFVIFILGVCVVSFSGCATSEWRSSKNGKISTDPRPMPQLDPGAYGASVENDRIADILKFEDIPIPAGFVLDMKDSFVFRNDSLRVGIVKYVGRGEISAVTSFFKRQMPLFNWELINSIEYYKSILTLQKDSQTSVVIIETVGGRIEVTIASGPNSSPTGGPNIYTE